MSEFFDFYGESKDNFYNKFKGVESVLVQGRHWDKAPLVTILLTTYRRCDLLKEALDSALNQIGFDDYQVIVVDNEGESIDIVTDTAKLLSKYDNDKVIYYRHKKSVSFKMDNAVKLAKSKWIVFLHDDDVLSPYHLRVLTQIASKNPSAKYISCPMKEFIYDDGIRKIFDVEKYKYSLYTRPKSVACFGYYPGWLGALIDREAYINSGGMPTYCNNLGDYCMVQKFHFKYGIWDMEGDTPLYFHRIWEKQASAEGSDTWKNLFVAEYEYYQYVSKVYHPVTYGFWERISSYKILDDAKTINRGIYKYKIDLIDLAITAGMSKNSLYRNAQYKIDKTIYTIIEEIVNRLFVNMRDEGEILI